MVGVGGEIDVVVEVVVEVGVKVDMNACVLSIVVRISTVNSWMRAIIVSRSSSRLRMASKSMSKTGSKAWSCSGPWPTPRTTSKSLSGKNIGGVLNRDRGHNVLDSSKPWNKI